ncbi:unnamed protein product [Discosporangium mesarthrocarpum]
MCRRPVLASLLPGKQAHRAEKESVDATVGRCMAVIRRLFPKVNVPEPSHASATRWGTDKWAHGSYSYVSTGSSGDDMDVLAKPVGDWLRFAGEATNRRYPASVHGAYLTGIREARLLQSRFNPPVKQEFDAKADRGVSAPPGIVCAMCQSRSTERAEGESSGDYPSADPTLVGPFLDGSTRSKEPKEIWVHHDCAAYSPEVGEEDGSWSNVIKAVRRGKRLLCSGCGEKGATVGCFFTRCRKVYHVPCCRKYTSWDFERSDHGKHFYCLDHRQTIHNS